MVLILAALAGLAWPKLQPLFAKTDGATSPPGATRAASAPGATPARAPLKVEGVAVLPQDFRETILSTGTLRAEEGVDLQPEVSGKIVEIHFNEGSFVRKGDLLVKINDIELQASLRRARAPLAKAQLREQRLAALRSEGGASQEAYDEILAEIAQLQAAVELVEAQITKTEIRVPFDGVIGLRYVSEGAYVTPSTKIATLQQLDRLKLDFAVPEIYGPALEVGSAITFSMGGIGERHAGQVYAIEPLVDINTRSVLARALCPNPQGKLRPGAFATVELTLSTARDSLLVPASAVIPGLTEKTVYVARDGRAVLRPVQTGTRTESFVQIVGGLAPGEVVITSGLLQLRDGAPVEVRLLKPAAAQSPVRSPEAPLAATR
jgi:membrane fusion protein (multidrug efflux system)